MPRAAARHREAANWQFQGIGHYEDPHFRDLEGRRARPESRARRADGVLDPQGKAIHHALEGLGFSGVNDVRAGKLIELDLADGTSDADIDAMCQKLLANTVIENYRIEKVDAA